MHKTHGILWQSCNQRQQFSFFPVASTRTHPFAACGKKFLLFIAKTVHKAYTSTVLSASADCNILSAKISITCAHSVQRVEHVIYSMKLLCVPFSLFNWAKCSRALVRSKPAKLVSALRCSLVPKPVAADLNLTLTWWSSNICFCNAHYFI